MVVLRIVPPSENINSEVDTHVMGTSVGVHWLDRFLGKSMWHNRK